ncbi:MAG: hypothetical protein ACFFER_04985 [Candidatus Thorarchaeota archaeon]
MHSEELSLMIINLMQTIIADSSQQIIIFIHVERLEKFIDNIIEVEKGRITAI